MTSPLLYNQWFVGGVWLVLLIPFAALLDYAHEHPDDDVDRRFLVGAALTVVGGTLGLATMVLLGNWNVI